MTLSVDGFVCIRSIAFIHKGGIRADLLFVLVTGLSRVVEIVWRLLVEYTAWLHVRPRTMYVRSVYVRSIR